MSVSISDTSGSTLDFRPISPNPHPSHSRYHGPRLTEKKTGAQQLSNLLWGTKLGCVMWQRWDLNSDPTGSSAQAFPPLSTQWVGNILCTRYVVEPLSHISSESQSTSHLQGQIPVSYPSIPSPGAGQRQAYLYITTQKCNDGALQRVSSQPSKCWVSRCMP